MDWNTLLLSNNIEDNWSTFKMIYNNLVDKHIPFKYLVPGKHYKVLWLNDDIVKRAKAKRRKAKVNLNRTGLLADRLLHIQACNDYDSVVTRAKFRHETNLARHVNDNPKRFYNYAKTFTKTKSNCAINCLIKDDIKYVEDKHMGNILNEHFVSVMTADTSNPPAFDYNANHHMSDIRFSENDIPVANLLIKIKSKKGDSCCFNNYRPISLLPTISKIFERVMFSQLYSYFNINNLLSEQQYSFRSQHSTELACVKLADYIIKEMDNIKEIKIPTAIFLDLSKAFDTLNFDILLNKLKYYGVRGTSLALIKSYLTNRYQYVQFENSDSELLEIVTGILQGSILGPLYFSVFINDLVNSSNKFQFLMYADDTTIYFSLDEFPLENREIAVNSELEKVNTWLKLNKLSINVNKTKFMFFTKRRHLTPLQFSMNNRSIDVVQHFNYLGIMLDENMSWKTHIAMVSKKLSQINGILHRLKYYFPQNILITLYKSLFTPHINYGSLLWGQAGENLDKIQKKTIRTITYNNYTAHTEPLLKELNLLKVKDMFDLKILKFLFKLYHNELPPFFNIYRVHLEKI